jgi:hypothetical protein
MAKKNKKQKSWCSGGIYGKVYSEQGFFHACVLASIRKQY